MTGWVVSYVSHEQIILFAGVPSPDGASHQPRGQATDQEHRLPQRQGQLLFCCSKGDRIIEASPE
jgi:hypothetical protein